MRRQHAADQRAQAADLACITHRRSSPGVARHGQARSRIATRLRVVRALVGHGIGRELHEEPQVPNYGRMGEGPKLREGMVLAIEPMVNAGTAEVLTLSDQWTVVTADRSLSAHFEHTVALGAEGPVILSKVEAD